MKKYFLVILLIIFIVPSIAFASWWNPFSWFNGWTFHKEDSASQMQIDTQKTSEEKIIELQKQIDDLKKQQPSTSTTTKAPVVEKKVTPKVSIPAPVEPTLAPALDYSKYTNPITGKIYTPQEYADVVAKQAMDDTRKKALRDMYEDIINSGTDYTVDQLNAIDCAYLGINCPTLHIKIDN